MWVFLEKYSEKTASWVMLLGSSCAYPGYYHFQHLAFVATEGQWLLHHERAHGYLILRSVLSSTDSVVQINLTWVYSSSRLATAKAVSWVMVSACFLYVEILWHIL